MIDGLTDDLRMVVGRIYYYPTPPDMAPNPSPTTDRPCSCIILGESTVDSLSMCLEPSLATGGVFLPEI